MTTRSSDDDASDLGSDASFLRAVAHADVRTPLPPEPDRVGTELGKYRIEAKLGAGGMGVVYRALDLSLDRHVAIKVLKQKRELDPEQRRRFLREARAASAVRHPNVAAVYEVGEVGDETFIAMELVPGGTLRDRLKDGPLSVEEAVRLAVEIARALGAAHAVGIVHRDLKPDNVILEPAFGVKVLDFGLARRVIPAGADDAKAETLTLDGKIMGTPGYMSPEQARGLPVDARADIFSLGVVLFELLTGERPFGGATHLDVLVATSRDAAPLLSARRRDAPSHVARVVAAMLEKEKDLRPASVDEVIAALEAAPPARRANARVWGAVALATVVGAATIFAGSRPPSSAPIAAVLVTAEPAIELAASAGATATPIPVTAAPTAATSSAEPTPSASLVAGAPPTRRGLPTPASSGKSPRPALDPLGDQK